MWQEAAQKRTESTRHSLWQWVVDDGLSPHSAAPPCRLHTKRVVQLLRQGDAAQRRNACSEVAAGSTTGSTVGDTAGGTAGSTAGTTDTGEDRGARQVIACQKAVRQAVPGLRRARSLTP